MSTLEINTSPCCCSLIEIGSFSTDDYIKALSRVIPTKELLFRNLVDYFQDNYYFYPEDGIPPEFPTTFFAVTHNETQTLWAKALKEAGFRGKLFSSRHAESSKEKVLTYWTRFTLPKEVKKLLKELND